MAALKSDLGLLDLPAELLDLILSYVPDVELINVRKVSVQFEQSFRRLICRKGRKLNFSRCYHLKEDLIEVLELGSEYITSVNINHCYWLTSKCLKSIMKLPKLQELHMIDCGPLPPSLRKSIPAGLSAWSFTWDETWAKFLKENLESGDENQHKLFGNLKKLAIHVEDGIYYIQTHCIGHLVLKYCLQLVTLTVFEFGKSVKLCEFQDVQTDYPDGLLPKLTKLNVNLKTFKRESDYVYNWIYDIFRKRKTLLNEVSLGLLSYSLLECHSKLTLPCINAEELLKVCFDHCNYDYPELPAIPKIWIGRRTPKCKVVSFQGLTLKWMSDTSKLVAKIGPQLQELNLKNCQVDINALLMGLTTIAKDCTQLTKLDLTLHPSVLTNDYFHNKLLIALSQFKALKVLHMSVGLLSRSKNLPNPKTVPGQQKSRIGTQMEISDKSMRRSGMWRLTQSCKEIKEFRITNDTWTDDRIVCECALTCISNWKKLKELHLVNIPTLGRGSFLPFITKNCLQLTTLYLANVCHKGTCNYTRSLVECLPYSAHLKDLSIMQDMELSSVLVKALGKCLGLERVYFKYLVIKPEVHGGFMKLLLEFPRLVHVWLETKVTIKTVVDSIGQMLKGLKRTRPSLTYYILNQQPLLIFSSYVPDVHLELNCYEISRTWVSRENNMANANLNLPLHHTLFFDPVRDQPIDEWLLTHRPSQTLNHRWKYLTVLHPAVNHFEGTLNRSIPRNLNLWYPAQFQQREARHFQLLTVAKQNGILKGYWFLFCDTKWELDLCWLSWVLHFYLNHEQLSFVSVECQLKGGGGIIYVVNNDFTRREDVVRLVNTCKTATLTVNGLRLGLDNTWRNKILYYKPAFYTAVKKYYQPHAIVKSYIYSTGVSPQSILKVEAGVDEFMAVTNQI